MRLAMLRIIREAFFCYYFVIYMSRLHLGSILRGLVVGLVGGLALNLYAGGSGLNTVVVINQARTNSIELGNYFCERRQVPPENVLRINWPGGNTSWSSAEFQSCLLNPLLTMLAARQLTNQIDYVVLSMDIPFQTVYGTVVNSTTAGLFYGLKSDSGPEWLGSRTATPEASRTSGRPGPPAPPGRPFSPR